VADEANKGDRADRFAWPEGAESDPINYYDEAGNKLSASEWLKRVKADAEQAKNKWHLERTYFHRFV
jgi:hypothetical protein